MMSEAHTTTVDPEVAGRAELPPAPDSGLVLVHVPEGSGDVCAWHLLDFALRWRDEGRRIHICDGCVDAPLLHQAADVENDEGVTDAILYGSSLSRISVPVEKDVLLTTAGTLVGDSMRVLDHPRWSSIAATVAAADGLLVVAVSKDAGIERLLGLADTVIRFVPGHADSGSAAGDEPQRAAAGVSTSGTSAMDLAETTSDVGSDGPPATRADAAVGEEPSSISAEGDSSHMPAGSGSTRVPERSGSRGTLVIIVLVVMLIGVLGAGYLGFIQLPGITPADVDLPIGTLPLR